MDQQDTSTEHGSGIPGRNEGLDSDRKDATRTAVHTNNQKTLGANPQNVFDEDSMQDTTDLQSKKRARSSSEGSKEENDMVLFKKALVSETPEPKTNQSVDSKGSPDSVDKARDPRIPPPSNEFTSTSEKPRPEDESLSSRSSMPSDQQDSTELGSQIPGQNGGLDFDRKDVTRTAVYTNNQKTLGANPQNVFDEDSMQDTTDLQSKKRARSSSEGSKEENDMVLFKKALVSETPEPKANQFADSKCSPDSVDKDRDPRIPPSSNEFTGISEKPRPEDESLSSRGSTPSEESSSPGGIFDDADEDDTFDLSAYKQPDPPPRPPLIRPDLVAAILGTPPKTKVQQPIILKQSPAQKADEEKLARKKKHTKPAKKLFITKKEQEGAEALVSGKVDLLKILPEKDCHFLGNELWIFTLQQLASILGVQMETSDTSPGDSTTSNMCTPEDSLKRLRAKLIKSSLLRTNRTKTDGNEFEREEQTKQKTSIQTPPVEASNSNDLHSNDAGSDMKQDPVLSSLDTQILGSDAVVFDSSNRFSPQPQDRDMQSRDSGKVRPAVDAVETKDQIPKETTQTGNPLRDNTSCSQDVEAKIDFWKKSIRKWQDENKLADDNMADKTHFPLDGPLSCLLPACTLRFLQSVKIKNAYDFMCLKRTETGVIVDMYRLWRSKCNLSDINALSLAKNLIAVGSRIEVALGSMPHADIDTIQWMSGPMIVLTGAAKDFVITDEKIYDANDFVGRRTKDMSNSLIKWRKSKGLPLLKGTGNVAMISQWKYLIKEEMNVMSEEGKIITEVDFAKEVKSASSLEPEKKKQKSDVSRETKIKSNKKRPPKVEAALHSETFLSTLFAEDKVQAMASVGVTTAQGFLDADKRPDSPLIRAVIKMRSNSASGRSLQPSSCVRLMYEWCQRVKQRLDDIEKGKDFEKKPVKRSKTDGKPAKKPKSSSTASIAQKKSSNDPFDSLSSSTKVFLASMEIDTAESFLSARTTDIANAFIKWREERNLPVLKGLGAVASVSGWKALVRKAAKHVGKEDIAALNPGSGSTGATETKSPVKIKKPPPVTLLGKPVIMHAIDRGVLFGLPRKRFSVANSDQLYQFELTVRKSTMQPSKSSLYLKYLGNHWLKGGQTKDEQSRCFNLKQDLELLHLPILTDHDGGALDDSTGLIDPFCSLWPQCGVVELSKYGVQPLPRQGCQNLKDAIRRFVTGEKKDKGSSDSSSNQKGVYTVFEKFSKHQGKQYFLYLNDPIEKNQAVELRFLQSRPLDDEHDEDNDIITRQWIKNQISQLSPKDLRDLLDFLNDNLGASIYRKLHLVFERKISAAEESASSTSSATQLSISRRKMHWVVLRINAQLQRELRQDGGSCDDAISVILPSVALVPLWTNGLVDILRKHPDWKVKICKLIMQEAGREIVAEFSSSHFGDFVSTRKIWCPMAERLFRITVDLLAGFTAELGPSTSEERLVNDICSLVSKAAQKVKSLVADPHNQEPCAYTDLVLTFQKGVTHNSNALPSAEEVRLSSPNQAYFEAMSLCDEPAWKPRAPDDLRVVATRNQETSDSNTMEDTNKQTEPLMQSVEEMKQGNHVIDLRWYIERQILPVVETVALSGVAHLAQHQDYKNLTDIQARIREAARAVIGDPNIQGYDLKARNETTPTCVQLPRVLRDQSGCVKMYQPNSLQLFLGLVWPKLRLSGWKLEAGELPSDVIFCPPRRNLSRVRLMKQEAARQRSKLSKKTNDLGLGYVAKSTKRLLINSAAIGEKMDVRENTVSVSDALGRFFLFQEKLVEDAESLRRLREIVNHVAHCFEELAPKLLYIEEKEKHKAGEGQKFIETLGCEYLMRLLVVMPSMLQQSDLSFQQVKDTVGVIRELTHFLVANHESLFDESLCLPHEEYREELGFTPYLVSRLKEVKSHDVASSSANRSADEDMDELRDVVLPKDRPDLTDFVDCVMSQVTVCRATDEDTGRKGRRVQIGHPGLVCKHCLGRGGEGKYFFGSIESFTTASTTIEKHIAKCPSIDSELKNKMVRFRARHAEQRKNMPQGVQGAFFARLWERLRRSSRSSMGGEADMFVTFSASSDQPGGSVDDEGTEAAASRSSDNQVEFKSHLQILHFLQSTSPWKDNKGELRDAFEQYYNCLEYGGQIYNTNAMPPHFNSEWLLSKIAPRGGASHR